MSICLPNLRTTSVFKVYYGGTGVTTLQSGSVIIGDGNNAVKCVTGSHNQVLTWDSTSGSWVAKDPTGGTGGSGGNVPDIVIAPVNNAPTTIIKKRFSNRDYTSKNNCKLIDWDKGSKGSFRITEYDIDRKYTTIYNDSEKDLFISVAEDQNPKIIIDFEQTSSIKDLKIKYVYPLNSIEKKLFEYNMDDIKNIHSFHTYSQVPGDKYGFGKNYTLSNCNNKTRLTIFLTPDYFAEFLNKHVIDLDITGSYHIFLENEEDGIYTDVEKFDIHFSPTLTPVELQKQYVIYTRISSSEFFDSEINSSSANLQTNGFDLSTLTQQNRKNLSAYPEDYSYILYSKETLTLSDKEATLSMFGYFIEPEPDAGNLKDYLIVRVTEAK